MKYPELEWKDDVADVSKWLGDSGRYYIYLLGTGEYASCLRSRFDYLESKRVKTKELAKQDAQTCFEERLRQPMDFGTAMAAKARGCQLYREKWEGGPWFRIEDDGYGNTMLVLAVDNGGKEDTRAYSPTNEEINADDWHFYFPPLSENV